MTDGAGAKMFFDDDSVENKDRPMSWMIEPARTRYMGGMRVRMAKTLIKMHPSAIMKLKGTRRTPAPRGEMPLTVWRRCGMSMMMML